MNFTFFLSFLSSSFIEKGGFRSFVDLESPIFFPLSFNLNKWFSHISNFSFCVFYDFVVWVRRCVVSHLVHRLISRLVAVFIWFLLEYQFQSITDWINDLGVDVADLEAWVYQWLEIYHIICRHFIVVCY